MAYTSPLGKRAAPQDELLELERHRNKRFRAQLDEADAVQAAQHQKALQTAAEYHRRTLEDAERAREKFLLDQQLATKQREIQQQEEIARARQELSARDEQARLLREQNERAAIIEQQRRVDEARKTAELAAARDAALKQHKQQEEEQERQRQEQVKHAAQRQALELAANKAQISESQQATPRGAQTPQTIATQPASVPQATRQDRDTEHQQYLAIHGKLKQLRKDLTATAKQDKALKTYMGDNRREITKTVGQMTAGESAREANRRRITAVTNILEKAHQYTEPSVDIREYQLPSRRQNDSNTKISAMFVYLLNIFVKAVIKQYIGEAGISPEKAEPVGLLVANVFSRNTNLVDILLAKFHKTCPVLFGIYGPNNTARGRERSGWLPISAQENSERMTGLGAGFASISSRDFSKAKVTNPVPVATLWRSLAMIVNTPANEIIDAHFLVLKALLEPIYVQKLVRFYGIHAVALVRKAVGDFSSRSNTPAANALRVLPDIYKKQIKLTL